MEANEKDGGAMTPLGTGHPYSPATMQQVIDYFGGGAGSENGQPGRKWLEMTEKRKSQRGISARID